MAYVAESVMVTQAFLKWLNKNSNCNVSIQHLVINGMDGPVSTKFRLYCEMCRQSTMLDDYPRELTPELQEFTHAHRHEIPIIGMGNTGVASAPVGGRKFRPE